MGNDQFIYFGKKAHSSNKWADLKHSECKQFCIFDKP